MSAAIDRLRELGFELIPEPPDIRLRWPPGPEPPEARVLLEELRANKPAALAELSLWDEATERKRRGAAFEWAVREPRRWAAAWEAAPPEIRPFLDESFDRAAAAWRARDVGAHCAALDEFCRVVSVVLDLYQLPAAAAVTGRVPA